MSNGVMHLIDDSAGNPGIARPLLKSDLAGGGGGGGAGSDRELVVATYRARNAFTGASVGDTITSTQIIDVTGTPSTVSTIWRNQTTAADLASAPSVANLELVGAQALTDAQLRASPLGVEVTGPQSASGAVLVGNNKSKLRDEFPGPALDPAIWEVVGGAPGDGMAITVGNGTTGSYLNINSGVNANSQTIIRSVESFNLPVRLAAFVTASQRIANTEFFVELVEVDAVTGLPMETAPLNTNAGLYRNHAAVKFDGTSATSALVTVRSGGAPEFVSAASTITTTAATGTGPNFFPAGFVEMQATGEHVTLLQAAIDATAAASAARRITQAAPSPNAVYKLQLRLRNLGTAPVSATDYRVHAVRLFDYTRLTTEIIGGPGHNAPGQSVPVNVAGGSLSISGTPAVTLSGTANAIHGAAAIDAALTGNPVPAGLRASNANVAAMSANGDVVAWLATMIGVPVVKPHALQEAAWNYQGALTTTADVAAQAAAGAGLRRHVVGGVITNTGAAAITVNLRDGTTTRLSFTIPANGMLPLDLEGLMVVTANTALNLSLSAAGTVQVALWGYTAP